MPPKAFLAERGRVNFKAAHGKGGGKSVFRKDVEAAMLTGLHLNVYHWGVEVFAQARRYVMRVKERLEKFRDDLQKPENNI